VAEAAAEPSGSSRRGGLVWLAGGIAAVALVAAFLLVLRSSAAQPALPTLAGLEPAVAAGAAAPGARGAVQIEIDSEPAGARVLGRTGQLGMTPFTLTLSASPEIEHLRFVKDGFEPAAYDLRPESGGLVFVELHPLGVAERK